METVLLVSKPSSLTNTQARSQDYEKGHTKCKQEAALHRFLPLHVYVVQHTLGLVVSKALFLRHEMAWNATMKLNMTCLTFQLSGNAAGCKPSMTENATL